MRIYIYHAKVTSSIPFALLLLFCCFVSNTRSSARPPWPVRGTASHHTKHLKETRTLRHVYRESSRVSAHRAVKRMPELSVHVAISKPFDRQTQRGCFLPDFTGDRRARLHWDPHFVRLKWQINSWHHEIDASLIIYDYMCGDMRRKYINRLAFSPSLVRSSLFRLFCFLRKLEERKRTKSLPPFFTSIAEADLLLRIQPLSAGRWRFRFFDLAGEDAQWWVRARGSQVPPPSFSLADRPRSGIPGSRFGRDIGGRHGESVVGEEERDRRSPSAPRSGAL